MNVGQDPSNDDSRVSTGNLSSVKTKIKTRFYRVFYMVLIDFCKKSFGLKALKFLKME